MALRISLLKINEISYSVNLTMGIKVASREIRTLFQKKIILQGFFSINDFQGLRISSAFLLTDAHEH